MRLLLDTVTFLWATVSPDALSRAAVKEMEREDAILELSTISISEIAAKYVKGSLNFPEAAVRQGIDDLGLRLLPYAAAHSYPLFTLSLHHRDPFDRMLISQALAEDIPIITSDAKFTLYEGLTVVW